MQIKHLLAPFLALASAACSQPNLPLNVAELGDNDPSTAYTMTVGENQAVVFDSFTAPMMSYRIYSSGQTPACDPAVWVLRGSHDGREWVELDRCEGVSFCSRFQEVGRPIAEPSNYGWYKLEFVAAPGQTQVAVGDVRFSERNTEPAWSAFVYPAVKYEVLDPQTEGAAIYAQLVQDPDAYIRYHARKVAEILFYAAADSMNTVGQIDYTLKDYAGISAKSGVPAQTAIVYSTQHIEKSAGESLAKLDFETRGVLYHELVHAYQFEPKGIGSYGTNKEFWACIEGLADAVRTEAGMFDLARFRKPGGTWLDGYKTTGFFLQWLTTKNPDALREFHKTVRDLDPWSFDGAMKMMFGEQSGIEPMWAEYQQFLESQMPPVSPMPEAAAQV